MASSTRAFVSVGCAFAALAASSWAQASSPRQFFVATPGVREFTGTLIARRTEAVADSVARRSFSGPALRAFAATREYVVRVPAGSNENRESARLMETGRFEYVHPNWRVFPCGETNDPRIREQWHLWKIAAPRAWDTTMGDPAAVVAVVDSGVALTHPDLQGQLVPGYNAVTGLAQSEGGDVSDVMTLSHGTRIAGIVAAKADNGIGIAGVGPNLKVMPVRITNSTAGSTLLDTVLSGARWAAEHGAKVINISYTGVEYESAETLGQYCRDRGAILVWAAGNEGVRLDIYDWPNVVIVGASGRDDKRCDFSNYGRAIDVMAPGIDMLSTTKNGSYGMSFGTSFAAPVVAASIALVHGVAGTSDLRTLSHRMRRVCNDMGGEPPTNRADYMPGTDADTGWGRLSLAAAVEPIEYWWTMRVLPRPFGYTSVVPSAMNDAGAVAGSGVDAQGNPHILYWQNAESEPIIMPYSWPLSLNCNGINEQGEVIFTAGNPAVASTAWRWIPGTEPLPFSNPGTSNSNATNINDFGAVLVTIQTGLQEQAVIWYRDYQVPVPGFGWFVRATSINNSETVTGFVNNQGDRQWLLFWSSALGKINPPVVGENDTGWAINNEGEVVGSAWYGSNGKAAYWEPLKNYSDLLYDYAPSEAWSINDFGEIIGRADSQPCVLSPYTPILPRITNFPRNYTSFALGNQFRRVMNNHGDIVGIVSGPTVSQLPVVLKRTLSIPVNLGQLGSNPVYVGTLPTTLVLDFRNSDNTPMLGSPVTGQYDSETGTLSVPVPLDVQTEYRIYLKPERYLGKLYPPMTEPPLPPETRSIPIWQVMVTGDIDGDNAVTVFDYNIMSECFDKIVGDAGYDWHADLDGDNGVTVFDYNLLSESFDMVGDE